MAGGDDSYLERFARTLGVAAHPAPEPDPSPEPSLEPPPGRLVDTPFGPVREVREVVRTAWPYSCRLTGDLLSAPLTDRCRHLADPLLAEFVREEALFLDVETTGLSHGAGTVAFLIGLGWFEAGEFVVSQLLLEDYDQEQAALLLLLRRLATSRFLVTYNGKSFDRSVLESRLVIHRFMDWEEAHLRLRPHLDLLHLGRRLLSGLLENHRLTTLEREQLHFDRHDDLPGALVPQHYFRYLLSREPAHIAGVLRHNRDDLVSLLHLADHLLSLLDPDGEPEDPTLCRNLGRLFARAGQEAAAGDHLERALALTPEAEAQPPWILTAATELARLYRRMGRERSAHVELWQSVARRLPGHPRPTAELARLERAVQREGSRTTRPEKQSR